MVDNTNENLTAEATKFEVFKNSYEGVVDAKIQEKIKKERDRSRNEQGLNCPDLLQLEGAAILRKQLYCKAEKVDVDRVWELKCNRNDLDNVIDV